MDPEKIVYVSKKMGIRVLIFPIRKLKLQEVQRVAKDHSASLTVYPAGSVGFQTPTLNPSCFPVSCSHLLLSPAMSCWAKQSREQGGDDFPEEEITGTAPGAGKGGDPSSPTVPGCLQIPTVTAPKAGAPPAFHAEQTWGSQHTWISCSVIHASKSLIKIS